MQYYSPKALPKFVPRSSCRICECHSKSSSSKVPLLLPRFVKSELALGLVVSGLKRSLKSTGCTLSILLFVQLFSHSICEFLYSFYSFVPCDPQYTNGHWQVKALLVHGYFQNLLIVSPHKQKARLKRFHAHWHHYFPITLLSQDSYVHYGPHTPGHHCIM